MAKYNIGDRLVLATQYINGWFPNRSPDPLTVQAVDEARNLYTLKTPNNESNFRVYTINYVNDYYRLASPDEVKSLF